MFTKKEECLLSDMRIDPKAYYSYLYSKFGEDTHVFCKLLDYFDSSKKVRGNQEFLRFSNDNQIDCDSELGNYVYELYNNLIRFFDGGVFELFKAKQAEWGGPRVNIRRKDIPAINNVEHLDDPQTIYRGLRESEHISQNYGQSWTIDIDIARRFSNDTYSDLPTGIVVEAKVSIKNILYFDKNDSEKEVIIESGLIINAKII